MANFITFIFQIVLFFVLINLNWLLGYFFVQKPLYPSEFAIIMTTIFFLIFVFINNVLMRIVNKKWFDKTITIITATIYTLTWIEDIDSFTFHALIFIFAGVIPILLKKKIEVIVRKKLQYEL
jgi:hypothetical protein